MQVRPCVVCFLTSHVQHSSSSCLNTLRRCPPLVLQAVGRRVRCPSLCTFQGMFCTFPFIRPHLKSCAAAGAAGPCHSRRAGGVLVFPFAPQYNTSSILVSFFSPEALCAAVRWQRCRSVGSCAACAVADSMPRINSIEGVYIPHSGRAAGAHGDSGHHDETRLLSCEAFQERCCSFIRLPALQDALQGLMAAMAQYCETRDLSGSEKPLFTAAAQSAIKVSLSAYETRTRVCAQGLFCCRTLTSFSQTWMQDQVACRARLLEP